MNAILLILLLSPPAFPVGTFSALEPGVARIPGWEPLTFGSGFAPTEYALVREGGRVVVRADSRASASGLVRRMDVDLAKFPILEWSWRIARVHPGGDATRRNGDDYPARVYVTFAFDPDAPLTDRMAHRAASALFGEVPFRAINYIWANRLPKGRHVPNPYTSSVCMIAVQSGNGQAGTWQHEWRDMFADYRLCFGRDPVGVNGIAIMTDSDNTNGSTTAWYGDVRVVGLPQGRD
jgi:hypothetical protein